MKENLYRVSMKDKKTGERIRLKVWAENVDEATHKFAGVLFGWDKEYEWTGSSPVYENNELVTREK